MSKEIPPRNDPHHAAPDRSSDAARHRSASATKPRGPATSSLCTNPTYRRANRIDSTRTTMAAVRPCVRHTSAERSAADAAHASAKRTITARSERPTRRSAARITTGKGRRAHAPFMSAPCAMRSASAYWPPASANGYRPAKTAFRPAKPARQRRGAPRRADRSRGARGSARATSVAHGPRASPLRRARAAGRSRRARDDRELEEEGVSARREGDREHDAEALHTARLAPPRVAPRVTRACAGTPRDPPRPGRSSPAPAASSRAPCARSPPRPPRVGAPAGPPG